MKLKKKRFEAQKALLPRVQKRFPAAFPPANKAAQPLKLGIHEDLLQRLDLAAYEGILSDPKNPQMRQQVVEDMLLVYTRTPRYLKAVAQFSKRVDLDGHVVQYVANRHRRHARESLQERGIDPKSNTDTKTKRSHERNSDKGPRVERRNRVKAETARRLEALSTVAPNGSTDAGQTHTSTKNRGTLKLKI